MKISLVLPVYNVEKYIERCLISCINQSYKNIEIIIVDDCGNDNSIKISKIYKKTDSRIKIIYNDKNLGTYHARRIGVENAKGDYILFIDPDDTLESNSLYLISKKLLAKDDILLYGVKNTPPKPIGYTKSSVPELKNNLVDLNNLKKIFSTKGFNLGTPGKIFKTNILKSAYKSLNIQKDTRLIFAEDILLFSLALESSSKITTLNLNLYNYHSNEESITKTETKNSYIYKLEQINYCINALKNIDFKNPRSLYIKDSSMNRLLTDREKLKIKIEKSLYLNTKSYLLIIRNTKSLKYTLKLLIFLISAKKIKLV